MKNKSILEDFNLLMETLKFDEQKNEIIAAETDWLLMLAQFLRDIFDYISSMTEIDGRTMLNEVGRIVGPAGFSL